MKTRKCISAYFFNVSLKSDLAKRKQRSLTGKVSRSYAWLIYFVGTPCHIAIILAEILGKLLTDLQSGEFKHVLHLRK